MEFLSEVRFEVPFEGRTVTGTMRRLKRSEFLKLLPRIQEAERAQQAGREPTAEEQSAQLDAAGEAVAACVTRIEGIEVDGKAAQISQIVDEMYFTELVAGIFAKLVEASTLTPEGEKKSAAP